MTQKPKPPLQDLPPEPITDGLLDWLRRRFPERCIRVDESTEQHRHYAGQVSVVTFLAAVKERQEASSRAAVVKT